MMDICFTSHLAKSTCVQYYDIYTKDRFWILTLEGLKSPLQQYRKQALYIMKNTIDLLSKVDAPKEIFDKNLKQCVPCRKFDNCSKQKILVYEALEEKQQHLVAPALTHVTSLVKASKEHRTCNWCFELHLLQCIFEKILHHENNNIVKWGVSYICKLDENIFSYYFIETIVKVLNNSFLYECQPDEECPTIVRELPTLFEYAEKKTLLNIFFNVICSRETWGPVAIFYVLHALRVVSHKKINANWQATELKSIKNLVEINLNMHSHILRTASQIELLRTIPNYVRKIDNLEVLADTLAAFHFGKSLVRGTNPWNIITVWLQEVVTKEEAITFVGNTCAKYLNKYTDSKINSRTFALMVYLLHDSNLILSDKKCSAEKALSIWLYTLSKFDMRPYADIDSSINVAEFMSHMLNLSTNESSNSIADLISLNIHITFMFLIKNMRKMVTKLAYEDYMRYTAIVSPHIAKAKLFMPKKSVNNYIEELQNESICLLKNAQHYSVQYLYGLHILYLSQNISVSMFATKFFTEHVLNMYASAASTDVASDENLKGKVASEYYLLLSKLVHQYLINSPIHSWISTTVLLSNLLKFLELSRIETISEVATVLTVLVDNKAINATNDRETLEYILELCWRCTLDSKKNNIYWTAIENLTGVIVNDNFFLLPNTIEFINKFISQLLGEDDTSKFEKAFTRFKRILLSKLEKLNAHNLTKLQEPLLSCLLHGSVLRRDERVENHAYLFITKHLMKYYPKHILALDQSNDTAIRAQAVILLHKIVSHLKSNNVAIVSCILEMLDKYKNKRHFNDSYIHKLKHRLMQILLMLEPVLSKEFVALLQDKISDFIFSESNQHSVRLMQEWLMIRIFTKNINLHDKLWKLFAESIERRPGCTISVSSIVYHVARLLLNDSQKIFIQTALPYVAQCCLGQQFNVRLYNQFILIQLCDLIKKTNGNDSILEYKGIYQAAVANLQQESTTKNSARIQDDFYFSNFHPMKDYSLQTIYFELPRLTNVNCDELISPDVFEAFAFKQNDHHPLQLYNINSFLSETKTSTYLTKSSADDMESLTNYIETYSEGLHDIQKKIDPSKSKTPLYRDVFETMIDSKYQQDLHLEEEGLIVVASFVSRPSNLGGIARTCEIFGVKTLVIANASHVKDKEFQSLSVSAERWINILQIKPHELQEYLLKKKDAGWSLIGIEQTANSINLLEAKFVKKTILVLGNEKDGIPANFIPLFDTCLEIPQVGIIRSLNVHVTAAICIWQFATQHTLK
ncbi:uncharacterized protein LOC109863885 isoform X2 [Pseudomyrmex gracilis]|nr:uncharacterized protein LOC109863885 isoform X2 [Pseudomyrmex gracilis]